MSDGLCGQDILGPKNNSDSRIGEVDVMHMAESR
jgi:hypothetical protein